jgi:hypothetical protein
MLVKTDKIAMCMRMTVVACMIVIVTVVVNLFLLLHFAVCIKFDTKLYNQTIRTIKKIGATTQQEM